MITHLVLFEPGEGFSAGQQRMVLDALAATVEACPSVRSCRVGRRVTHGLPGYEQTMARNYQYALVLEFDDLDGLRRYLAHPDHAQLGHFFSTASHALAYDFDVTGLEQVRKSL